MKNRLFLPILFVLSVAATAFAQTSFEVQWTPGDGVMYNGLIWNTANPNVRVMRVKYYDRYGFNEIEQTLVYNPYRNIWFGQNPRFIYYSNALNRYTADNFMWYGNKLYTHDGNKGAPVHYYRPIYNQSDFDYTYVRLGL